MDFDSAAPPLLTTVRHDGKDVPVVIQGNKAALLYVLNRDTGKPVFPIEERPVPQSDVPGERTSPTQPFPLALRRSPPTRLLPTKPGDRRQRIAKLAARPSRNCARRNFHSASLKGTLMVPGNIGGMTWSGYAFDPQHSLLVTNTNNIVAGARLMPRVKYDQPGSHDEDGEYGDQTGVSYGLFRRFLQSPSDLPCSAPPWGLLTAVDMNEGKIRWQVPLGSMQDFGGAHAQQIPPGSISLGGPIVTAGGIVFIAAPRIHSSAASTSKPVRNCGKRNSRLAPMPHQ